jgi:hypothetical protein
MKNIVVNSLLIILLFIIGYTANKSFQLESKKRILKTDLVELSDIKYGMLNADQWRDQFAEIISKKINNFEFTGSDRAGLNKKIQQFLYRTIDKFEASYKKENKKKSLLGISFKNIGADVFEIFTKLKQQVPSISSDIIHFLGKDENKTGVKKFILNEMDTYKKETFQDIDYDRFNSILSKYETTDSESCKEIISSKITKIEVKLFDLNLIIVACLSTVLLIIFIGKYFSVIQILLFILIAILFLVLGISLPMINLDARISALDFHLMGETISFKNQMLFYKSKSIIEMSQLLLAQKEIKVMLVGILVLLFSVIFPITKLTSSFLLILKPTLKNNKAIRFFVFKIGKWSMADVMVVAIFMSYLGFSSIISSQLNQIEYNSDSLSLFTMNNSELQNGFFYFLSYVILSIRISQLIANSLKKQEI